MDGIKEYVLSQTYEKKVQLLEDACDDSFGVFMQLSKILLEAPCGEGGGLPTEVIDEIFQRKLGAKPVDRDYPEEQTGED